MKSQPFKNGGSRTPGRFYAATLSGALKNGNTLPINIETDFPMLSKPVAPL